MDDYSTSRGNGSVYGFLEPQCIHNARYRRQACQDYIEKWVNESQRQLTWQHTRTSKFNSCISTIKYLIS